MRKLFTTWPYRALPIFLFNCIPLSFSGSNVPMDHTFALTPADIAAAESDECAIEWITSDPGSNRKQALALLDDLGIKIVERKADGFALAGARRLFVGADFHGKTYAVQSVTLTHELYHYCQRDASDKLFEAAYMHSAGRWRIETPAWSQSIRTMLRQGASDRYVAKFIDTKLVSMRDFYWLHDIDPAQYELETRRIWESQH